jgi:hypothetical protein
MLHDAFELAIEGLDGRGQQAFEAYLPSRLGAVIARA